MTAYNGRGQESRYTEVLDSCATGSSRIFEAMKQSTAELAQVEHRSHVTYTITLDWEECLSFFYKTKPENSILDESPKISETDDEFICDMCNCSGYDSLKLCGYLYNDSFMDDGICIWAAHTSNQKEKNRVTVRFIQCIEEQHINHREQLHYKDHVMYVFRSSHIMTLFSNTLSLFPKSVSNFGHCEGDYFESEEIGEFEIECNACDDVQVGSDDSEPEMFDRNDIMTQILSH